MAAAAVQAQEVTALNTVVVTGTRSEKTLDETPVPTDVVDRREMQRTQARTLKDALENVPGLQLTEIHGKSGFQVSLQGMTSDQVLVLIDGLPISASTGSSVDVSQYLLTEVERIEVVKGASSAQYGSSAMGGVINVITRRIAPGLSAEATADVGTYGGQNVGSPGNAHGNVRVGGGSQQWRASVAADVLDNKGFAVDPDAWSRQGDAIRREQYSGRLEWLPTPAGQFWLDASRYRETDTQRYTYFAPPTYVPQRKTEDITRDRLAYGGQWRFGNGVKTRLAGVTEDYDSATREYSNAVGTARRNSSQRTEHVSLQVDLPAWQRQLWQFGADVHRERLRQNANGISELARSAERTSHELFLQNDILFNDTWEMVLGLRAQDDSDFGTHYAPKIGLRANLPTGDAWKTVLRANFGQGYRVPNLKERHYLFDHSALGYVVLGNPNLKPESSNSFQFGGTATWNERLSLSANLFHNRVRDLIQTDTENFEVVNGIAAYTYRNVSRARTQGLETGARWQASSVLALNAGYTFTDTEDLNTGQELTRRPRSIARVGFDWQLQPATELSVRARYQSSELAASTSPERSPGWATLDFVVNQKLGRDVTAFFGVKNLTNRQRDFSNASDFGPVAGRFLYLGARISLDAVR
ncbi:TonB-dependent receptor plug domain-containing protein [Comamonas endophytica]|uniref:TonB-dependent receptor n=1 Tax=Comamonas endophytica TaxID=2949090 RepID=A0ABY6GAM3_9BURK|nr:MULTISPECIES: TonB-dependent receptor [unclassified Acidovorax]MCD2513895.1 TonB-dependent receptor [Acidovorax sp. D4N7]UYG52109.1 TonB-dependent receptor [Acidovorax sp. 5MLIR]